jgi:hypothetical protein
MWLYIDRLLFSNIDETRNGNYQFRFIAGIIKNNCKLIMVGPLKDIIKRKYEEEFIKYGLPQ